MSGERRGGQGHGGAGERGAAPPQNYYALFRDKLKHPSAQPVILQLRDFVARFPAQLPRADAAKRVHRFLKDTQEMMLSDYVVFASEADDEGRVVVAEGLEKFILSCLHPRLFAAEPADVAEDRRLRRQIASLQWVDFRHLGVPAVDPMLLELAIDELRRMDNYKAPRDKLVCVVNACRVVADVLKRTLEEQATGSRTYSADDFLPLLIFACLRANPPRLQSNLEFVAAFRHPSRLIGEEAYFLTVVSSAVAFVRDAGPKALDVAPEEFERLCAAELADFDREEADAEFRAEAGRHPVDCEASTVAEKAASLPAEARKRLSVRLEQLPLRFEVVPSGRHLRISDVPALMAEYKDLARLLRDVCDSGSGSGALESGR